MAMNKSKNTPIASSRVKDLKERLDTAALGREMFEFVSGLYPICRSITGNGVRETLRSIGEHIPLEIHEVPSGTRVLDWTVPKEWNISDAYIKNSKGERVVDFQRSNLHVVSYSIPVKERMRLTELRPRLFTLPERPDWIPYRTSYHQETWGFCLRHSELLALGDDEYEVCIASSLEDGSLTFGELLLPGSVPEEVLISTHICHPSLCNDNLSGLAVNTFLAKLLSGTERRYSYRFVFIPVTIGSITWLAQNEDQLHRISHGLVGACLGDPGPFTYKRSRRGEAEVDRAACHALRHSGREYRIADFSPYGYDERQYCSPGFNLPVGVLSRSPHGQFPEYHTSADSLDLIRAESLGESVGMMMSILDILEGNARFLNTRPKGEPQLGRRGLYGAIGGVDRRRSELSMLWVLNLSDGKHSLLDIAERADLPFHVIEEAAATLQHHGLLEGLESEAWEIRDPNLARA